MNNVNTINAAEEQSIDVMAVVAQGYNKVVEKTEQATTVALELTMATPAMWSKSRKSTSARMSAILADILGE